MPYQWAWDTTKYPNGVYTITVKAYDTIGNVKTRDITVTVNNVEVPWLQANLLTIAQVAIGLGGLTLAIVTYWSRTRDKRKKKKTTKKKEQQMSLPKKTLANRINKFLKEELDKTLPPSFTSSFGSAIMVRVSMSFCRFPSCL
jgi:hypothetical protein